PGSPRRRAVRRASRSWARSSTRPSPTMTSGASPSNEFDTTTVMRGPDPSMTEQKPFRRETDNGNDVARSAGFAVAVRLVRGGGPPRHHGYRPRRHHGPGIR